MTDPIKENYTESIQTKIAAAEALPEVTDGGRTWTIRLKKGIHFAPDPADRFLVLRLHRNSAQQRSQQHSSTPEHS